MSLDEEIEKDLAEMEGDTGSVTFKDPNGVDRVCTATSLRMGAQLEIGGESVDVDLVLTVRVSSFKTVDPVTKLVSYPIPQKKQKVSYQGKTFRIDHVIADSGGIYIDLGCVSPNRGA